MAQSTKLGTVSAFLLVITLMPPYSNWRFPINFVCLGLSIVLSLLAAQQGSKWWLTIPGLIVAGVSTLWWIAAHTF